MNIAGVQNIAEARKNIREALGNPQQREKVAQGIEGQREHFDNVSRLTPYPRGCHQKIDSNVAIQLELHIGYVYGSDEPPAHASFYHPKFSAGARLPHVWISFACSTRQSAFAVLLEPVDISYVKELSAAQTSQCQWSTLDLRSPESFTLIVGEQESPENTRFSVVEKHFDDIKIPLNVWRLGEDFDIMRQSWFASEIYDGGLLIRPDQHIIIRISGLTKSDEIISVLDSHLGI